MKFEDLPILDQLAARGLRELKIVPTYLHDDVDPPRIDLGFWSAVFKFPNDRAIQCKFDAPVHPMSQQDVRDTVSEIHLLLVEQVRHGYFTEDGTYGAPMPEMVWHLNDTRVIAWLDWHINLWLATRVQAARAMAERGRSPAQAEAESAWREDTTGTVPRPH